MDELSKKSNPMPRPVYEPEGGIVNPPDNDQQGKSGEYRPGPSRSATQVEATIFREEDASKPNRWLTPEAKGITISTTPPRFVSGQGGKASTRGLSEMALTKAQVTGDETRSNPQIRDAEPKNEHRNMPGPPLHIGDQRNRTVK
jgi:hypothetical protein